VNRARFIAAARLEFLAEVIYYNEAEARLGRASLRQWRKPPPEPLPFLNRARRFGPILAGSSSRVSRSRSSIDRSPKESSFLPSLTMRAVPITGNLAYMPANRRIDADRLAAGHAGR